jgi:hypothetical protein
MSSTEDRLLSTLPANSPFKEVEDIPKELFEVVDLYDKEPIGSWEALAAQLPGRDLDAVRIEVPDSLGEQGVYTQIYRLHGIHSSIIHEVWTAIQPSSTKGNFCSREGACFLWEGTFPPRQRSYSANTNRVF